MKIEWEWVTTGTERLKVFGGWVLRTKQMEKNWIEGSGDQWVISTAMVFISDPDYQWKLNNPT